MFRKKNKTRGLQSLGKASFTSKQNIIHACIQNDFLRKANWRSDTKFSVCVFGRGGGTADVVLKARSTETFIRNPPWASHYAETGNLATQSRTHAHTFNDKCSSTCARAHARIYMQTQLCARALTHTRHENSRKMSARLRLVRRMSTRL